MASFDNVQVHNCPACGTKYKAQRDDYICCECKYPVNSTADSKVIDWSKKIIQSLQREEQITQKLKEEKEKLERQNKQEKNKWFYFFKQPVEQILQHISDLSNAIRNLSEVINSFNQQKQFNSNPDLDKNSKTEKSLELSQQNNDSDVSNNLEGVEDEQSDNSSSQSNLSENNSFTQTSNDNKNLNNIPQFLRDYNHDKNLLLGKAIATVSETAESISNRRDARDIPVQLEVKASRGSYWIINEEGINYLVPTIDIKFNEFNLDTLQALFEYDNSCNNSYEFQLIKPAKVSQISSKTWQIEKKGKLDFY